MIELAAFINALGPLHDNAILRVEGGQVYEIGSLRSAFTFKSTRRRQIGDFLEALKGHYGERIYDMANAKLRDDLAAGRPLTAHKARAILDASRLAFAPLARFTQLAAEAPVAEAVAAAEAADDAFPDCRLDQAVARWSETYCDPPLTQAEQETLGRMVAADLRRRLPGNETLLPINSPLDVYQAVLAGGCSPMREALTTVNALHAIDTTAGQILGIALDAHLLPDERCGTPEEQAAAKNACAFQRAELANEFRRLLIGESVRQAVASFPMEMQQGGMAFTGLALYGELRRQLSTRYLARLNTLARSGLPPAEQAELQTRLFNTPNGHLLSEEALATLIRDRRNGGG